MSDSRMLFRGFVYLPAFLGDQKVALKMWSGLSQGHSLSSECLTLRLIKDTKCYLHCPEKTRRHQSCAQWSRRPFLARSYTFSWYCPSLSSVVLFYCAGENERPCLVDAMRERVLDLWMDCQNGPAAPYSSREHSIRSTRIAHLCTAATFYLLINSKTLDSSGSTLAVSATGWEIILIYFGKTKKETIT